MDNKLSEQLCQNTIFEGLTTEQVSGILPCILYSVEEYGSEECIYDKGESVGTLGVVIDGGLLVCEEKPNGSRTAVASIEKNGLFGEEATFSTAGALNYRVIAGKNTRIVFLSRDFFLTPCSRECSSKQAHQKIMRNMLRLLSDRTIMLNKKVAYLSAPDLKTKIAMYLCELYETTNSVSFTMPLNRDRLAEFFSVARPSLSRELIGLKNQGVIDFYRSSVTIMDLDALYELARS